MRVGFAFAVALMLSASALAQANNAIVSALPDAPLSQDAQTVPRKEEAPALPGAQGPFGPIPALLTRRQLTLHDKFIIYTHQAFGPPALIFPAFGAGVRMANPPSNYPPEWTDGGGAFGRLYGNAIATQTSKRTAAFLTESVFARRPALSTRTAGCQRGKEDRPCACLHHRR